MSSGTLRAKQASREPQTKPHAVLIDGSALYFATRSADGEEDRRLNYFALIDILTQQVPGLKRPGDDPNSRWTMWTAADPRNVGQQKFLEFAEQRLCWEVRRIPPWEAYMVEPDVLFGIAATDRVRASRLIRFDAQIAFAIGRLAESHRLIVISDSYALKEPMAIVNRYVGTDVGKSVLAFFASSRESRWASALRSADAPEVINLDDFQAELFGIDSQEVDSQAREPGTLFY